MENYAKMTKKELEKVAEEQSQHLNTLNTQVQQLSTTNQALYKELGNTRRYAMWKLIFDGSAGISLIVIALRILFA